jgi:hypothetical protein
MSEGEGTMWKSKGIDGRTVLKWISNKWEDVNWIHFAENSEYYAFVDSNGLIICVNCRQCLD